MSFYDSIYTFFFKPFSKIISLNIIKYYMKVKPGASNGLSFRFSLALWFGIFVRFKEELSFIESDADDF